MHRHLNRLTRFLSDKPYPTIFKMNTLPAQLGDILQTSSSIVPSQNYAFPVSPLRGTEQCCDLARSKHSLLYVIAFNRGNSCKRVEANQPLLESQSEGRGKGIQI